MQQKLSVRNFPLFKEIRELPFRCPRCGEQERFRSLSSLRAHLDHSHAYHTLHDLGPTTGWRPADALLPDSRKARDGSCTERCKSACVETRRPGDPADKRGPKPASGALSVVGRVPVGGRGEEEEEEDEVGACVRRRLEEMLRAADSSVERRLLRVSTELARADSELLRHRARSEHLAQEKQELHQRERALSRQVDTAVMVIATLRQQLCVSEQELERKEQEAITIHHFLDTAVQHEMCGKVRLQNFIENLLQRISLAERLLKYYQSSSSRPNCTTHSMSHTIENRPLRITKSRSAGGLLESGDRDTETREPSDRKGRYFPKFPRESQGHTPDYKGEGKSQHRPLAHYEV